MTQEVLQGDNIIEDEDHSGQPLEVDNHQLRAITEADLTIISCPRTQHWPFYGHSAFEANCKGEKAP